MQADSDRWKEVTPSPFHWEREALEFVRELVPDHEPYRAWTNFEFQADDGSLNEVDLLLLTRKGCFLVEIKSWPGELRGDWSSWVWTADGQPRRVDNPLPLTNKKAKRLKQLLQRQPHNTKAQIPFIEPIIFLSAEGLTVKLDSGARQSVLARSELKPELIDISPELHHNPRFHSIDKPAAKAVTRAMALAGIKRKARKVGDYVLEELLFDGRGFQDWQAKHVTLDDVKKRVRVYTVAQAATDDLRGTIRRAAEREFRILQGVDHPGILKAEYFTEGDLGPSLVFNHDPDAVRLDHFVGEHHAQLDASVRLDLLRQIAEALQYAHGKRLVHRALGPQSILVRGKPSGPCQVVLFNWQTASRGAGTAEGGSATGTSHVDALIDNQAAVYMAPEALLDRSALGVHLDVFSLGTLAWLLFTGEPPANTMFELAQKIREGEGLHIESVLNGAPAALQALVLFATQPQISHRYDSVGDFLRELDQVEEELTRPEETFAAPAEAKKGDHLQGGWQVAARLGKGSTAIAYVAERADEVRVLKVALDPTQNDRLRDEGEILQKLRHPAIVQYHDTIEVSGHTTLVLDRAGTDTLSERLRQDGSLHVDLLERFGADLLGAVGYLETEGIAHRDLKPDNLGVAERGRNQELHLVLFDFSLSRAPSEQIHAGTQPYLEPFLKLRTPPRWDLAAERYAAAVTLYEMATGTVPQWGTDDSDPAMLDCEATIEADRFPAGLRDPLNEFFMKALKRDPNQRFDDAEGMLRSWKDAFARADQSTVAPDDEVIKPADPDAAKVARAMQDRALVEARLDTPLSALHISTRGVNALDRVDATTVKDLLALPKADIWVMRGVGQKTRRELLDILKALTRRFPDVARPEKPATRAGLDSLAAMLLPRGGASKKDDRRVQVLRLLLGLDPLPPREGRTARDWPALVDVAGPAGMTSANVGNILNKARTAWSKHPALNELREELVEIIAAEGGVMTAGELAAALLAARGSALDDDDERNRRAHAVARAVVEVERKLQGSRLIVRRCEARVLVARDDEGHDGQRLLDHAQSLGQIADQMAELDPLPSPGEIQAKLRSIWDEEGPSAHRLVRLAAHASQSSAVSSRLELYPQGLDPARALRLAHGALLGPRELTAGQVEERIRARYPACGAFPPRPELDALLKEAGIGLVWSDPRRRYVVPDAQVDVTSDSHPISRRPTDYERPLVVTEAEAEARRFEERLKRAQDEGAFLVLPVRPSRSLDAERELTRRFEVAPISFEAACLNGLRETAAAAGAKWDVVLAADAAPKESADGQNLRALVRRARPAIERRLIPSNGAPRTILLTQPGLLARYGLMDLVETLRDRVGARPTDGAVPLHGLWLLVPCDDQSDGPVVDGVAVPVITPGQWARIPEPWLENRHRSASRPEDGRAKQEEEA